MKTSGFLKISSIIPLVILTLFLIIPMAQASESENDIISNTETTFNEATDDSEQKNAFNDTFHENSNGKTPSPSSELCISLNEKLKWFFSFESPDFIEDLYEKQDDFNYRAFVGFHIAL